MTVNSNQTELNYWIGKKTLEVKKRMTTAVCESLEIVRVSF
ncbi:MAG: hypothetical protein AB1589_27660 [Cyanobacteriota bacterium]